MEKGLKEGGEKGGREGIVFTSKRKKFHKIKIKAPYTLQALVSSETRHNSTSKTFFFNFKDGLTK